MREDKKPTVEGASVRLSCLDNLDAAFTTSGDHWEPASAHGAGRRMQFDSSREVVHL